MLDLRRRQFITLLGSARRPGRSRRGRSTQKIRSEWVSYLSAHRPILTTDRSLRRSDGACGKLGWSKIDTSCSISCGSEMSLNSSGGN
jgi:hypothetical protein